MTDVRFILLSTHGDVHHVIVLRDGHEECVIEFDKVGVPAHNWTTGDCRPTGKLTDWKYEQRRARKVAEDLAKLYRAELIVDGKNVRV